ncbi:MAG: hypothetical protein ABEI06_05945 [Halobacteriaceae archaeon]
MRLDAYIDELSPDADHQRRQLAKDKSYEIIDHIDDIESRFKSTYQQNPNIDSKAPSVFVGRSNYPNISSGILAPVKDQDQADEYATSGEWYDRNLGIESILKYRTGLINSRQYRDINVNDIWEGFLGTQREIAIADKPVDVEIGLANTPEFDVSVDDITTPTGPNAEAENATLRENPHVPPAIEKTLEDDEWQAEGAINYLYRRGYDVYQINNILSVGALGKAENRKLVPTRWSITAVDDTIGKFLRGRVQSNQSIGTPTVWMNEYLGNRYWIIITPGKWEFELVEMKSPGSIWNPDPNGETWLASAHEGYTGRSGYVDETAGAYYAARLAVLEYLTDSNRQGKCLVLREVSDEYWAPVGVWQIRESIRNAFDREAATAETLNKAVQRISKELPMSYEALKQKSNLVSGVQTELEQFL